MNFVLSERTAIFIDGNNLFSASRNLGFDVDYRNLLEFFRKKTNVIRAHYYTALVEDPDNPDEFTPLKPLTDWLSYNGYSVVTKTVREFTDAQGRRSHKSKNMSVDLAIDALELAPRIDHAVVFAGDADLSRFLDKMKSHGVRATVVSSIVTQPPLISDELRRHCDQFIDLKDISAHFTKAPRAPRRDVD